ncbi:MAG: phycobilisome degradation protein nblA [Leptolyngbya sp. SIO4C5]|uniref:NblA/ycf18 family protein n=1 Tax=Sphaerothrix gracilis TaxID=3151835 RepID=UPI0013C26808|nr:phycobilisome degradation protein nblA [Leptolyngbya sp. SIO4C5]
MNKPDVLTIEQQFRLQVLRQQVDSLTLEEAQEYLFEALKQLMIKDNWVKQIFKECYLPEFVSSG